jgi:quinol monooxygenase YgiN
METTLIAANAHAQKGARLMLARLTSIQLTPDKLEEVTSSIAPALAAVKASPGFQSALLLADRATGKATMVTVWESEAAMQASNPLRKEQIAKFAPLIVGAVSTEVYEVVARA